jgi:hypothetical protein
MADDEAQSWVQVLGWGMLKGKEAKLIIALSKPFIRSREAQLLPPNFAFTMGSNLEEALGCDNNETFRRCVTRCRGRLGKLARAAGA